MTLFLKSKEFFGRIQLRFKFLEEGKVMVETLLQRVLDRGRNRYLIPHASMSCQVLHGCPLSITVYSN